jgi:hypothetical protein
MRTLLLAVLGLFLTETLIAQSYSGVSESQYSGYLGTTINPANLVNPHYKADIHLLSFNTSLVNDYFKIRVDSLLDGQGDFFDRIELVNTSSDYANAGFDLEANWLGVMVAVNDKISVGVGAKTRVLMSARGFNRDLIRMAASSLEDSSYYSLSFTDDNTSLAVASWNEYALYFGAEVWNVGAHTLKVGGALNFLQSNGSFYLYGENLTYEFQDEDTIANVSGIITYGGNYSNIPSNLAQTLNPFGGTAPNFRNFGVSMDLGAVYEYTPSGSDRYKLKAGLAFHDIGFLAATPENSVSNRITFDVQNIDVNFFDGIQDFDEINAYVVQDSSPYNYSRHDRELMMQAPTRLNFFVDYNILTGLYVSFLSDIALHRLNNGHKLVGINSFELTPRYDFKWFGFALPINYVQHAGFGLGLGLRLGPVYFGTANLITSIDSATELSTFNAYAGVRIPLHKK